MPATNMHAHKAATTAPSAPVKSDPTSTVPTSPKTPAQPMSARNRTGVRIDETVSPSQNALTVEKIIATARRSPVLAPARGAWQLSLASAVLLWASFYPLNFGSLGWFALVPLILLVRLPRPTRWQSLAVYGGGFLTMLVTLQWMRLGDAAMYPAWLAMSIYVGLYFPLFVGLSRVAVHRIGLPLTLAVPVVWTGLEFFRATVFTGFGWYLLGHTQHEFIELIQISDITGVYGVSFVVALVSAGIAALISPAFLQKLNLLPPGYDLTKSPWASPSATRRRWIAVTATLSAFAMVLGYGIVRRQQAAFVDGPRVALVQGNFPTSLKRDRAAAKQIFQTHYQLTGIAVHDGEHPDLIVWPETMYRAPLYAAADDVSDDVLRQGLPQVPPEVWRERGTQQQLAGLSDQAGAALMIGLDAWVAEGQSVSRHNSALLLQPEVGVTGRYDKQHRVPFGEYVPLAETFPLLKRVTPMANLGIQAGRGPQSLQVQDWHVSPIICYEDTVPHLVRRAVSAGMQSGRPVDVLVNLTNDGWFTGSSELVQHLVTAKFRAVECRIPLVRAVNTGVSAFVDGDGVVREPDVFFDADANQRSSMHDPETGRYRQELNAVLVDTVPLDPRSSVYVRTGDWFSGGCAVGVILLMFHGLWFRGGRKNAVDDVLETDPAPKST